ARVDPHLRSLREPELPCGPAHRAQVCVWYSSRVREQANVLRVAQLPLSASKWPRRDHREFGSRATLEPDRQKLRRCRFHPASCEQKSNAAFARCDRAFAFPRQLRFFLSQKDRPVRLRFSPARWGPAFDSEFRAKSPREWEAVGAGRALPR